MSSSKSLESSFSLLWCLFYFYFPSPRLIRFDWSERASSASSFFTVGCFCVSSYFGGLIVSEVWWNTIVTGSWISSSLFNSPGITLWLSEGTTLGVFEFGVKVFTSSMHALFLSWIISWSRRSWLPSFWKPSRFCRIDKSCKGVSIFWNGIFSFGGYTR